MRMRLLKIVPIAGLLALQGAVALAQEAEIQPEKMQRGETTITEDVAREIALRHIPGQVESVQTDTWNNQPVWSVAVESEDGWDYRVFINPENGRIVEVDG